MGVLFFGFCEAGASPGNAPPMLTTPPSSSDSSAGAILASMVFTGMVVLHTSDFQGSHTPLAQAEKDNVSLGIAALTDKTSFDNVLDKKLGGFLETSIWIKPR